MGKDSEISWTHHTFNPWRGCTKVSPGCTNCYAETLSHRNPATLGVWGDKGTRVVASEGMWREPLKWDRAAKAAGERHRVFCASLADVFEKRDSLAAPRARLLNLIARTPNLDWLLLTKRPENVLPSLVQVCQIWAEEGDDEPGYRMAGDWFHGDPPANVWLGTSVEDLARADERILHLVTVPAAVRFLSMEPLLGPVDLDPFIWNWDSFPGAMGGIGWVIVGGESGPHARPMHPDWARSIRDQCVAAGVPFHFKQWGEWSPLPEPFYYTPGFGSGNREYNLALDRYARRFGASVLLDDRPEGWDRHMIEDGTGVIDGQRAIGRVGKKAAGRLLDGRTWDQLPTPAGTVA